MSRIVGIPRGLFFYRFYTFWKSFFDSLGVSTVVSAPSNKAALDLGISLCVSEACLPVKLYHAHAEELKEKAEFIFVPRFVSLSKNEYICPKLIGLPDMLRGSLKAIPKIIDVEVNLFRSAKGAFSAALKTGEFLGCSSKRIRQAYLSAQQSYTEFKQKLHSGLIPVDLAEERWEEPQGHGLKILLLGHSYNVYDSFLNMGIIERIKEMGGDVTTPEMMRAKAIRQHSGWLNKPLFWEYGSRALGCIYETIGRADIDGVIYLTCFGCGIDSFVCAMAERRIRRHTDLPFITITLDEQSGRAGMGTRIEAFMDTLNWRRNGNNLSTHGQRSYMH